MGQEAVAQAIELVVIDDAPEPTGWVLMLEQVLGLVQQNPLGILVVVAIAFAAWQSRQIREMQKEKDVLAREMWRHKADGVHFSDEAEQTIVGYDRRKKSGTGSKRQGD